MAQVTNQQLLDEIRESREDSNIRFQIMEQTLKKLNEAMYGNGEPGVKERLRAHEKRLVDIEVKGPEPVREATKTLADRLATLEQTHAVCPIMRLEKSVEDIEKRHGEEDKIIQDGIEDREQEEDAARKFRWETLALAIGLVLNLIISLVHNYLPK